MRKNKGFTLMEMLIIVGMIAALIAIGYPYFRGVMEKNKENADIAAMHSAEALMETAYNTRLIIDKRSAREANATRPLYYDPSGKLVWKRPAPYGQGTDGNQGVTWSCCGDYAYNPANDYRQGVVVCYYTPEGNNNPYPGIHVHWDCDGTIITPDPVPKPTKPVFPERPTTEPTEGPTDPDPGTNVDPDPDTPDQPDKKDPYDHYFDPGKAHEYPVTENGITTGYGAHIGHKYVYNGKVYVSLFDGNATQNYDKVDGTPEGWYASNFIVPNGDVITDDTYSDQWPNQTQAKYGTVFITEVNGTKEYYIYKGADGIVPHPVGSAQWVKILDCPDHCGANHGS